LDEAVFTRTAWRADGSPPAVAAAEAAAVRDAAAARIGGACGNCGGTAGGFRVVEFWSGGETGGAVRVG
jgi:hypothetical protein